MTVRILVVEHRSKGKINLTFEVNNKNQEFHYQRQKQYYEENRNYKVLYEV